MTGNNAAISNANDPCQHEKFKHVAVKEHFIREKVEHGDVRIVYCPTAFMLADLLTKAANAKVISELLPCLLGYQLNVLPHALEGILLASDDDV
jgi:hypothetical protein